MAESKIGKDVLVTANNEKAVHMRVLVRIIGVHELNLTNPSRNLPRSIRERFTGRKRNYFC